MSTIYIMEAANLFCGDHDPTASKHLTLTELQLPALQEMYHWRMKKDAPDNVDLLELVRVIPASEMTLPIKNKR